MTDELTPWMASLADDIREIRDQTQHIPELRRGVKEVTIQATQTNGRVTEIERREAVREGAEQERGNARRTVISWWQGIAIAVCGGAAYVVGELILKAAGG